MHQVWKYQLIQQYYTLRNIFGFIFPSLVETETTVNFFYTFFWDELFYTICNESIITSIANKFSETFLYLEPKLLAKFKIKELVILFTKSRILHIAFMLALNSHIYLFLLS